jgi:thioredoxin reductase (NADPH)
MKAQVERFGVEVVSEFVESLKPGETHSVQLANGESLLARAVIIATGAQASWLGLANEKRLMGRGISACATCDGYFFQGKRVVVVGGGDSAMEEALTLAKLAHSVTVVHRRDKLRASQIMQKRAHANPKISFVWNSEVSDVFGEDMVAGVEITDVQTSKTSQIDCEGLFVAIGHKPASGFLGDAVELDKKGYVVTREVVFTSQAGIFAAGDVVDAKYRQAITAAGDGCRAALEAEKYLVEIQDDLV